MKRSLVLYISLSFATCIAACNRDATSPDNNGGNGNNNTSNSIVNYSHLNNLCTTIKFSDGVTGIGVYIYSNAPNYTNTDAPGEGYTCVDDVSRTALAYLRSNQFATDTAVRNKVFGLLNFVLEMQSSTGYFYNFLLTGNQINTSGSTSANTPNWWSWRALQALTEAGPIVKTYNTDLSNKIDVAVSKLIDAIKQNQVNKPQTTTTINGITIPQWLPAESGADQAAILILGLIPYAQTTGDDVIKSYIKKLADGIAMMQQGAATQTPYGCFLSSGSSWHAYGCDQSYALLRAGLYLNETSYKDKALVEVKNFYTWLLNAGMKSSFDVINQGGAISLANQNSYPQIAYDLRPMIFASIEAYTQTGDAAYADIAGHLAAWFLGSNAASVNMYSSATGVTYDGITAYNTVNKNSGAESTIEAILALQRVEANASVLSAMNKYKK